MVRTWSVFPTLLSKHKVYLPPSNDHNFSDYLKFFFSFCLTVKFRFKALGVLLALSLAVSPLSLSPLSVSVYAIIHSTARKGMITWEIS